MSNDVSPSQRAVLIAEDEPALQDILSTKCAREGFRVTIAKNGREALDLVFHEHPDIILLDLLMPVMSGLEFLAELRKDAWGKTVPVFVLSNSPDQSNIEKAIEYGCYHYYIKSDTDFETVITEMKKELHMK